MFHDDELKDRLESELFSYIPGYADALLGYVIMPSHVHLLVGCRNGGLQLSKFMQSLKSLTTRKLFRKEGSIWQVRFDDRLIQNQAQLQTRLEYIHFNPVKAGLAAQTTEWKLSSAQFWSGELIHPTLTKSWTWLEK